MWLIQSAADMAAILRASSDTTVGHILLDHVSRLSEYEGYSLEELAHFLIVQTGDRLREIDCALGFELAGATPEYVDRHDGWYELVVVISDGGFDWVVIIQDDPGVDDALLRLCRDHAQLA